MGEQIFDARRTEFLIHFMRIIPAVVERDFQLKASQSTYKDNSKPDFLNAYQKLHLQQELFALTHLKLVQGNDVAQQRIYSPQNYSHVAHPALEGGLSFSVLNYLVVLCSF